MVPSPKFLSNFCSDFLKSWNPKTTFYFIGILISAIQFSTVVRARGIETYSFSTR